MPATPQARPVIAFVPQPARPSVQAPRVEDRPALSSDLLASVTKPGPGGGPKSGGSTKLEILSDIDTYEVKVCQKCELCRTRTHTVFGEGDPNAPLMFIGEGPGENEDQQGRPFCGRAGDLLEKMIVAMGLSREKVYIANTVKCRPPENRTPTPDEIDACWSYLRRQIDTIRPQVIVALGAPATKTLLNTKTGITSLRGTWHLFEGLKPDGPAIAVMPTFHPAYLLRSYTPENRKKVWDDLQKVMSLLKGETQVPGAG